MITKNHHYYLIPHNSYPLLSSLGSFNFLFSLCLFLKFSLEMNFILGTIMVIISSLMWWTEYMKEFNFLGFSSMNLENGIKMSMILFISSEILFFFSFFWSYFHFFLSPGMENGYSWPSWSVQAFEAMNIPFLNTLILLSSGILVTISHFYYNMGKKKLGNFYLLMTFFLGMIFTFYQSVEYKNSFFSLSDGNFGTSFFMLTGFHGLHVLIGSIFLFISLGFSSNLIYSKKSFLSFELACWYWHFVDVVWIFLFFFLYYLNN